MKVPMNFDITGEPAHTRCLAIALRQGKGEGEESSIDFRADILDLRKGGLMELAGCYASAGIIHKMEVLGRFRLDTGEIEAIDWSQSHVAHEANDATRGECCRDPMQRLGSLVGVPLGKAFALEFKQRFGGPLGCSHITTLLQELSSVVTRLQRTGSAAPGHRREPGERIVTRSVFLDGHFTNGGATTEVSVRVAELEIGGKDESGNELFASHDEARIVAEVDLTKRELLRVAGGQRTRSASDGVQDPSPEADRWTSRSEDLSSFAGSSLSGGMARTCLERFGTAPEDELLLSAMLSLSPGMTQVAAALTDSSTRIQATGGRGPLKGGGPCFMLRSEGPLMARLFGEDEPAEDQRS